ncbi:MAG: Do family serine endopeptidase [Gammaproteobacteria bacterium TMED243]|jgi:serine protease Do/serine protease DegQ|nr:serine endoprotease DegQ [Gammaproteobacteria bacterium]RPG32621.1 MAG: Do family serine endopeptidase [Gammaproteobacteria bacterium TMED243]
MVFSFGLCFSGAVLGQNALQDYQMMPVAFPQAVPSSDPDGSPQPLPSLANMLERVNPAVVNIATRSVVRERNRLLEDPFFRRFFNVPKSRQRYRRTQSAGSGVVVDASAGYIVTNAHVVKNADEISIGVSDGRTLEATLIGMDPEVDLALLQVPAEDLTEIDYADSARLRVGDFVVAIGNPFGLNQTVTSGIISALGRSGLGIEGYEDFIQTDASINPGNSGGALVDLNGRLVGINTAIFAPSGGNIGIGFAIPANMVSAVAAQLIKKGEINRGFVGAIVQPLNRELAKAFGVISGEGVPQGVVVVDVQGGSSAEQAGLEPGDVIVQMGGNAIVSVADFSAQAAVMFIGDEVEVRYVRQGEKRQTTLRIIADQQQAIAGKSLAPWLRGVQLQNLREDGEVMPSAGVVATEVGARSPAYGFGLRPGDVIVAANRIVVEDIAGLREAVRRDARQLLLRIFRNGRFYYVVIR